MLGALESSSLRRRHLNRSLPPPKRVLPCAGGCGAGARPGCGGALLPSIPGWSVQPALAVATGNPGTQKLLSSVRTSSHLRWPVLEGVGMRLVQGPTGGTAGSHGWNWRSDSTPCCLRRRVSDRTRTVATESFETLPYFVPLPGAQDYKELRCPSHLLQYGPVNSRGVKCMRKRTLSLKARS